MPKDKDENQLQGGENVWTLLVQACFVVNGLAAVLGGTLLPEVMSAFDLSPWWGGLFISVPAFGIIVAGSVGSLVSNRIGPKRTLGLSLFGLALSFTSIGFAPNTLILLLSAAGFGIVNGLIEMTGNAIIAGIHRDKAARELNRLHFFFGVGAFVGPLVVAYLFTKGVAWEACYLGVAILSVLLATYLARQPFTIKISLAHRPGFFRIRSLLRRVSMIQVLVGTILLLATEQGITGWITTYLRVEKLMSPEIASLGLATFWLAMLAGRLLNSHLPATWSLSGIIVTEALAGTAALLLVLTLHDWGANLVGLGLVGLAMAGLYPTLFAYASGRNADQLELVSGVFVAGVGMGKLVGPQLIGFIANGTSISTAMYATWIAFAGVAVVFSLGRQGSRKVNQEN